MQRGSGILLGISSLPGKFGIGTLGRGAREFIDRLAESHQMYWQILPVTPTGFGDSPYQSVSAFAGNPYFIDFEELYKDGYLTRAELADCEALFAADASRTDYILQFQHKQALLRKAYGRGITQCREALAAFAEENTWLPDYALFMAVQAETGGKPCADWPEGLRLREEAVLAEARVRLKEETEYYAFVQYLFFAQWRAMKEYANEKGVKIIGDMPIYIARDSADAWAKPEMLDPEGSVAGCPPDYFSETGQLWDNPLYDWQALKKQGYGWWIDRVAHQLRLFDYVRIDHFRGFEAYYSIPADAKTAESGHWVKGPGQEFFRILKEWFGELPLIAEDLGFLTPEVGELLAYTGFPGLKVLHFAFEPDGESAYLPHKYEHNCVVYTGTHDNDTTLGWYGCLNAGQKAFLKEYLGGADKNNVHVKLARLAMASVADVCIIPMQDLLGLPTEARMNTPQTAQGNWKWRLQDGEFTPKLTQRLQTWARVFGRAPQ